MTIEQLPISQTPLGESRIFRRPILRARNTADFDAEFYAHITRYERAAALIIEQAKLLGRSVRVLDVGCGELWPLRTLISTFWLKKSSVLSSYIGVDIEKQSLDFVGEKLASSVDIQFHQQDLTKNHIFKIESGSIDVVISLEAIEHMPQKYVPLWMEDLNRCMRSGAVGFFSTPNLDYARKQPKYHADYEWGFEDLRILLETFWELRLPPVGTFIRRAVFRKANDLHRRIPNELVALFNQRFGPAALRNILAVPYPEYSENVCWWAYKL